jgi:lysophospholipase L1-like esterase
MNLILFNRGKSTLCSFLAICIIFGSTLQQANAQKKNENWTGSWATAAQSVDAPNVPPTLGLSNNTFRQIIRVSLGGKIIRLCFSNHFSRSPLEIKTVSIAVANDNNEALIKTNKILKFNGKDSITLSARTEITCDPIKFNLKPGSRLAITICYGNVTKDITGHPASRTTSYLITGNSSTTADFSQAVKTDHWYTISRLEVLAPKTAAAIAVLGNSIADGRGSGINKQNRWPDVFSARLLKNKATSQRGVLNVSIGGSSALSGGMERLEREVFGMSNVKYLILTIGVNDIGTTRSAERADQVADGLINFYKQVVEKCHAKGIKVYGAPILPFGKSFYDADYRQVAWAKVNNWIRTSKTFDAVIDFEPAMRNPELPNSLLPNVHDNDWLHPNQLGYKLMGESIDLKLFE